MRFEVRLMDEYLRGLNAGRDEGRAEGQAEGKMLVAALREAGRLDELPGALEDDEIYQRLLKELGIERLHGVPAVSEG